MPIIEIETPRGRVECTARKAAHLDHPLAECKAENGYLLALLRCDKCKRTARLPRHRCRIACRGYFSANRSLGRAAMLDVANLAKISEKALFPPGTVSKGRQIPSISVTSLGAFGSLSASESRSTTSPTSAAGSNGNSRMPICRSSRRPARAGAGRASSRPLMASTSVLSSATSRVKDTSPRQPASMRSCTSRDLPDPDAPRTRTARAPTRTHEA